MCWQFRTQPCNKLTHGRCFCTGFTRWLLFGCALFSHIKPWTWTYQTEVILAGLIKSTCSLTELMSKRCSLYSCVFTISKRVSFVQHPACSILAVPPLNPHHVFLVVQLYLTKYLRINFWTWFQAPGWFLAVCYMWESPEKNIQTRFWQSSNAETTTQTCSSDTQNKQGKHPGSAEILVLKSHM